MDSRKVLISASMHREMIDRDLRTKNEFYISPLYNLFIEDGKKIVTESVDKYACLWNS